MAKLNTFINANLYAQETMHIQMMDSLHTKNMFYLMDSLNIINRSELMAYIALYEKMAFSVSYYYAEDMLDRITQRGLDEDSWNYKEGH